MMIEYSKTAEDIQNRVKDLAWMQGRFLVYIAIGLCTLGLGFVVYGLLLANTGYVGWGIQFVAFAVADMVVFSTLYKRIQKAVNKNFDEFAVEDRIDYTIETTEEDKLLFTRLTDGDSFEISWGDIKKIKYMKTILVLVLKNKRTIDMPRSVDLSSLMETKEA